MEAIHCGEFGSLGRARAMDFESDGMIEEERVASKI
jgi:hypothetical protein